jgi:hypothetical protein
MTVCEFTHKVFDDYMHTYAFEIHTVFMIVLLICLFAAVLGISFFSSTKPQNRTNSLT